MIAKVWTGFMLLVLAGLLAALAVAFAREKGWHPLRELSAFVRRQSFFELLLLLTFIGGMWAFASTKHGAGGDGGTNNVPRGAVVELASRGDAESQGRGTSDAARALWQSGIGRDLRDFVSLCETNRSARTLTDDDFERGFVAARVGTRIIAAKKGDWLGWPKPVGESVKRPMKHIRHHDPEVDGGGKLMLWYEVDDASAAIAEIDLCLEIAYRQQCGKTGKNVFPACWGKLEFLRPKLGSISLRKSGYLR